MTEAFYQLSKSEDVYVKKYYNTEGNLPDLMIFAVLDGKPSEEFLNYVKEVQEILENEHKRRPRVLFNCEEKPGVNKINHFFSVIGQKMPTEEWWTYSGQGIEAIWIKKIVYSPRRLVERFLSGKESNMGIYEIYKN